MAGKNNPADVPTRLGSCKDSLNNIWFYGPMFLKSVDFNVDSFIKIKHLKMIKEVLVESKKCMKGSVVDFDVFEGDVCLLNVNDESKRFEGVGDEGDVCLGDYDGEDTLSRLLGEVMIEHVNVVVDSKTNNDVHYIHESIDIVRFSSLMKLINTTAFVRRFINNLKARVRNNKDDIINEETPTMEEVNQALGMWIKSEQCRMEERKNFNKLKSSLNLFVGDDDFLRLKGRFGHSRLEYDLKHPILLHGGESFFTQLVVRDAHNRVLHHGVETTLSHIRSKYWIIKGRNTVKNVLRRCIISKHFQGKVMSPPVTPDLPSYRVDNFSSFHTTGLDYAGPLYT